MSALIPSRPKGLQRGCLVVEDLKDAGQLGHLKKVSDSFGWIQKFYGPAAISQGCVRGNKLTQAGTVDIRNLLQINQKSFTAFGKAALKCSAKRQPSSRQRACPRYQSL